MILKNEPRDRKGTTNINQPKKNYRFLLLSLCALESGEISLVVRGVATTFLRADKDGKTLQHCVRKQLLPLLLASVLLFVVTPKPERGALATQPPFSFRRNSLVN